MKPILSNWTKNANAGDTIMVTGWGFSNNTGPDYGADTQFVIATKDNFGHPLQFTVSPLEISGDVAKIKLPDNLPENTIYSIAARNAEGTSNIGMINQAETWWTSTAETGGTASIYGRNFTLDGNANDVQVILVDSQNNIFSARETNINQYRIDFEVPAELKAGEYSILVNNGEGVWSNRTKLTVKDDVSDNYSDYVINAKTGVQDGSTLYQLKGDGVTDDSVMLNHLIRLANARVTNDSNVDGATVYLPEGTYYLKSSAILLRSDIKIIGDGEGKTILQIDAEPGAMAMINGNDVENVVIENLTYDASATLTNPNLNSALKYTDAETIANTSGMAIAVKDSENITFKNLEMDVGNQQVSIDRSTNINLEHLDYAGRTILITNSKQVFADDLDISMRWSPYAIGGAGLSDFSLTNSTARLDDLPGNQSAGRLFVAGSTPKGNANLTARNDSTSNYYIANNTTNDMSATPGWYDQNMGEQILWENPYGTYFNSLLDGHNILASSATTLKISGATSGGEYPHEETIGTITSELARKMIGASVSIVDGKGIGQTRFVTNVNSNGTVTLDKAWLVTPDANSEIIITRYTANAVVYENNLDGQDFHPEQEEHTASFGVMAFKGGENMVIDGNKFTDIRYGVSLNGQDKPNQFTEIKNNIFDNVRYGIELSTLYYNAGVSPNSQAHFVGVRATNNDFINTLYGDILLSTRYTNGSDTISKHADVSPVVVFENNHYRDGTIHVTSLDRIANGITIKSPFDAAQHLNTGYRFEGYFFADSMVGTNGNDTLYSAQSNDTIHGGAGNDLLIATASHALLNNDNDALYGGAGNDTLIGGIGRDSYHFFAGDGQDIIQDNGLGLRDLNLSSPDDRIWIDNIWVKGSAEWISGQNYKLMVYNNTTRINEMFDLKLTASGLTIAKTGNTADQVLIENYKNGTFGIELPRSPEPNPGEIVFVNSNRAFVVYDNLSMLNVATSVNGKFADTVEMNGLFKEGTQKVSFLVDSSNKVTSMMKMGAGDDTAAMMFQNQKNNSFTIYGEAGNDTLVALDNLNLSTKYSTVVLHAGMGNDAILSAVSKGYLYGDLGNDTITSQDAVSFIKGGAGADYITLGAGIDTLFYTIGDSTRANYDTVLNFTGRTDFIDLTALGKDQFFVKQSTSEALISNDDNSFYVLVKGSQLNYLADSLKVEIGSSIDFI